MEPDQLDYIINIDVEDFIRKYAAVIDSNKIHDKVRWCQTLGDLCRRSREGHTTALNVCQRLSAVKKKRYRFSCLIDELKSVGSSAYRTALLQTINSFIDFASTVEERNGIRNEMIGLKLHDLLKDLSKDVSIDSECKRQLDRFHESKSRDDEELVDDDDSGDLDLGSHLDVFHAVWKQTRDTPRELVFLSVLRHLLQIDLNDVLSDVIWGVVDKFVSSAVLLTRQLDAERLLADGSRRLLKAFSDQQQQPQQHVVDGTMCVDGKDCRCQCHQSNGHSDLQLPPQTDSYQNDIDSSAQFATDSSLSTSTTQSTALPPVPPPPPPPAPPGIMSPPPPPPPPLQNGSPVAHMSGIKPSPRHKLRKFQWIKIPTGRVTGKMNLWTKPSDKLLGDSLVSLELQPADYVEMEKLFAVQTAAASGNATAMGMDAQDGTSAVEKKKKVDEVNLLDGKKSLNVNIYLRQFRLSHADLVDYLRRTAPGTKSIQSTTERDQFCSLELGIEQIRGLQKVLPDSDEVEMLRNYTGEITKLGNAEKFYFELIKLPDYRLRVEALLVEAEFNQTTESVRPAIKAIIITIKELLQNKLIHQLLHLILTAGNFLNSGGYAGDAAGFRLNSLMKLSETRTNKPGVTLLNFIASVVARKNEQLLAVSKRLLALTKEASLYSVETLTSDIQSVRSKVKSLSEQKCSAPDVNFSRNVKDFVKRAQKDLESLDSEFRQLDKQRLQLADFYCEDEKTFNLDECIKTFSEFFERFDRASQENIKQAEAESKRNQQNEKSETIRNSASSDVTRRRQLSVVSDVSARTQDSGEVTQTIFAEANSGTNASSDQRRLRYSRSVTEQLNSDNLMDFLRSSSTSNTTAATAAAAAAAAVTTPAAAGDDLSFRSRRRLTSRFQQQQQNDAVLVESRERVTHSPSRLQENADVLNATSASTAPAARLSWREAIRKVLPPRQSSVNHDSSDTMPSAALLPSSFSTSDSIGGKIRTDERAYAASSSNEVNGDVSKQNDVSRQVAADVAVSRQQLQELPANNEKHRPSLLTLGSTVASPKHHNDGGPFAERALSSAVAQRHPYDNCTVTSVNSDSRTLHQSSSHSDVSEKMPAKLTSSDVTTYTSTSTTLTTTSPKKLERPDTWRWGRVFNEDDCNRLPVRNSSKIDNSSSSPADQISTGFEKQQADGIYSRRAMGNIDEVPSIKAERQVQSSDVQSNGLDSDKTATSPPFRAESLSVYIRTSPVTRTEKESLSRASMDTELMSICSRDEGFESAADNASQSDRSSVCFRNSTVSYLGESETIPSIFRIADATLAENEEVIAAHDESTVDYEDKDASSSTSFFARSIDSLVATSRSTAVAQERVPAAGLTVTGSLTEKAGDTTHRPSTIVPEENAANSVRTKTVSKFAGKQSLADLTERLSRPKRSAILSGGESATQRKTETKPTGRENGKQSNSVPNSSFVRGSLLRSTMPASVSAAHRRRTTDTAALSPASDNLSAPEPPRRTSSIRVDSSKVTSSQKTPVNSSRLVNQVRKPQPFDASTPKQSPKLHVVRELGESVSQSRSDGLSSNLHRDPVGSSRMQEKAPMKKGFPSGNVSSTPRSVNAAISGHRTQRLISFNTPQHPRW